MTTSCTSWSEPAARHVGRRVELHERLDSTNTRALALAEDPANDGVVVLAREQTAGRGQYGRSWSAPPGSSVLLSVLVFPPEELRRPIVLTAWAAVSVCSVARALIGGPVHIKWPNDILVEGKKLCGILIEQRAGGDGRLASVVGIGLNVMQSASWFREAGLPDAVSLACLGEGRLDTVALARRLIHELDEQYVGLRHGSLAALEASWAAHLDLLGKEVCLERHAEEDCRGRVRRLCFAGLQIELPDARLLCVSCERIKHVQAG